MADSYAFGDRFTLNPTISRSVAEKQLRARIEQGVDIMKREITSHAALDDAHRAARKWHEGNQAVLIGLIHEQEVAAAYRQPSEPKLDPKGKYDRELQDAVEDFRITASTRLQRLRALLDALPRALSPFDEMKGSDPPAPETQPETRPAAVARNTRVFVVHGHDEGAREMTARFLEQLGLDPIILHDQPNQGRTIIEKFEHYADVGFAVVLLTPDDRGRSNSARVLTSRARQNVVMELGFFLGKLGRKRVCTLYVEGVELPSDYFGVAFLPLDRSGTWRLMLARELKAAGYEIDLNLLINDL
jgi:predicted nucleotide-binding protein